MTLDPSSSRSRSGSSPIGLVSSVGCCNESRWVAQRCDRRRWVGVPSAVPV